MAKADGTVYISTKIDTTGFKNGMDDVGKQTKVLSASFSKLGKIIGAAFAIGKIVDFGKKALELGSDLHEVKNVVDVTFTTMSNKVDEFAKNAAESAGLSETMAKRYVGTFGAMAKSFGFVESEAFGMSTALTQLAGDVASFYNITQDEAYTKLKSVFTGETESLKELGVVMTQSALDSFAMAEGLGKTTRQMTEQEKVALRYRFVLDQLSGAQGDFARTSDSWANQIRILKLNIESIMASIGQALINFFTPIIKLINVLLGKIAILANSFKAFSEMIMGKKSSSGGGGIGQTAADLADLESGYGGAADKAEDLESATKKADKANQKYLSGLDEIRTFSSQEKDEGSGLVGVGGIGGISGSPIDYGAVQAISETASILDELINRAKELGEIFKSGFFDGLGDASGRIESIKAAAASIKDSLGDIFDAELGESFNQMVKKIIYSLGQIAGSVASVGLSIGANLIGGISKYLESDKGRIKEFLIKIFDITGELFGLAGDFSAAFAYIFESIASENGQQLTANLIGIFSNAVMYIIEYLGSVALKIVETFVQPFIDSKELIKGAIDELILSWENATAVIKTIVDDIGKFLMQLYEKIVVPFYENWQEKIKVFIQEHLVPLMGEISNFVNVAGESLGQLWNELLKPLIQWLIDNVLPIILPIMNGIVNAFMYVLNACTDIIGGLIRIFSGLIQFLAGKFTGDWEMAWSGVKSIFSGIINSLSAIIEGFVNGAIGLLNGLIEGTNNITGAIGLPSIPTIREFRIPRLATGAVIPPNAPFLAMLGDQKSGTNIEAPLETIKQAVREVVGSGSGTPIHAHLYLDGKEVFDCVIEQGRTQRAATGKNKFLTI